MNYPNLSALLEAIVYLSKEPVTLDAIHKAHPGVARGEQREKVMVYGRSRGRAGEFLLLLVTGARGEIQRGKEIRTE